MGKYDKEVKEAKKIIDEWVGKSEEYRAQFIVMKKNNLQWEKHAITEVRALLDGKTWQTNPKIAHQIGGSITLGKENLEMFAKEGERIFKAHNDWAMAEARKGFAKIAEKLKFGKPGEERYEGINKELGGGLEPVSKALRETEGVWNKDVKFAIENQRLKLKAIAKEYEKGDEARDQALAKQMTKVSAEFEEATRRVLGGLLFVKDKDDLNRVLKGDFNDMEVPKKKQKYEQYQNKLGLIPGSRDQITKNLGRVQKAFPQDFLDGAGKPGFANLEKVKKDAFNELIRYEKYYKTVIAAFEMRHWH